ncbi:MAG: SPOR domain-containing protein [Methylacidiphilales bacterium]|nr:SPOR domain-containing protein [Candidatus Methylacidiphilales bacterium]
MQSQPNQAIKPFLFGFSAGIVLVALIWLTVHLIKRPDPELTTNQVKEMAAVSAIPPQSEELNIDPPITLSFREQLRIKDKVSPVDSKKDIESQKKQTPLKIKHIQVGYFSNKENAEKIKAQLILLNIPVTISVIKANQQIRYLVLAGPFAKNEQLLNSVAKLKKANIDFVN